MPPLALDCPLCCNETFASKDSLKYHLLRTIDNLRCRICGSRCSDILELVEHLERNCAIKGSVKIKTEEPSEEYEDVPQTVEDEDVPMEEGQDGNSEDHQDNDPNGLYSCLMCNTTFSSIEKHLEKYHDGEEVLLETDEVPDGLQDVENNEDQYEDDDQEFNEDSESQDGAVDPLANSSQRNDADDVDNENEGDDGDSGGPPVPIVEKYLFDKGFDSRQFFKPEPAKSRTCDKYIKVIEDAIAGDVRLLQDDEADMVADKSKISEILRCPTCTLKFPNTTHYEKHKCIHAKSLPRSPKQKRFVKAAKKTIQEEVEGKYKCTFCLTRYPTLKAITDHMKSHLVEDESGNIIPNTVAMSLHVCELCNTKFPTLKSLRLHAKMHKPVAEKEVEPPVDYNIMGETPDEDTIHETFECPDCGKEFDMKYKDAHLKSHSEESEYNCSICNKKFYSQINLEMHMKVHTDVKKFTCSYCKKPFNTYEALQDHTKKECLQKPYECQYCGRRFSKPHEKVKHERIHTGEKPHICQVCGKGFRVSFCLTLHMRTHTGTRPYMCNQCGKRFKSNGVYVHHMKTHSDVRNYKCPFCAKAFKTSVQLSSHKNSHTKPFSCTECNRPFASLYAVRTHMATHKKENNLKYDCWLCGATYARSFALKDHMNSVHMDYSITGEQNGDGATLQVEEEEGEVEYEQVVDEEGEMQIEFHDIRGGEMVKQEVTSVEVVEA